MKKRLLALMMAAMMAFALAACGSDDAGNNGQSNAPDSSSPAWEQSSEPDGTNADFKVGAIYINSKNDTAGYTYAHHTGITKAMEELGMDPASQLVIVDEVPDTDYDKIANAVDTLVASDCNIIFAISFGYMQAVADKAEEYPNVIFSHATGYMSNETNFNNYFGRIYQARYLAGIAAGLKSLETGNNNIGYVSAYGTEYAETCSGINGFTLGAQSVNPNAKVYVKELGTWADEVNESAFAKELIQTYNCGVISQHCDSAQPQIAAQDAGVFGCGYNSDMTADAPKAHLTAAIWHWNVYYHTAIQAAMDCNGDASQFVSKMGGSAYYGGLKENFVDVSPLNEATVAAGTQSAIDAVRELIVSGAWDVFSGVKLHITVAEDGTAAVEQADEALVTNDGTEIVAAGGASVEDSVITGTMNYFVAGVEVA